MGSLRWLREAADLGSEYRMVRDRNQSRVNVTCS
jgi:hypothetical protein